MVDLDATTPQLKAVKKFLDAWMSLDMKEAGLVLSNGFQFESLPECTDLPKQTKSGCGERRFPRRAKLECVSNAWEPIGLPRNH